MENFDNLAEGWDNDPKKIERAKLLAKEINEAIVLNKNMEALEFGCGTGLLSFQLKDKLKTITLADSSEGMLKVLREKIVKNDIKNFIPLKINETEFKPVSTSFHLIYTLMTLHHVMDIDSLLNSFHTGLHPGGFLCIADLLKEDGSFHAHLSDFEGHNGFEIEKLSLQLENNGFSVTFYKQYYEIIKKTDIGTKSYPLFLMIGKKV